MYLDLNFCYKTSTTYTLTFLKIKNPDTNGCEKHEEDEEEEDKAKKNPNILQSFKNC